MTHNPDVLCCLANLSNDEVFTPPQLANEVLDLLPKEIWNDPTITFLDPCCKTGVFLREITRRLIEGLKDEIPDLQERINHILTKQVFGIAITELTALMTRRTLYCSKEANGKYSVCTDFGHSGGNIYYNPSIKHDWKDENCSSCGASKEAWERGNELESHAYAFIHKSIEELFHMKFDVIIGNPPYQLSVPGNKTRAISIYHKFVEKAIDLNPKYISMIIPAKWLSQKSMENFKNKMFNDKKISHLIDYTDAKECFPDIQLEGGVCYFLWNSKPFDYFDYISVINGKETQVSRNLEDDKCDVFIRDILSFQIIEKVSSFNEISFKEGMSGTKPFGLETNYLTNENHESNNILLYVNQKMGGVKYIKEKDVKKNKNLIGKYKVLISKGYGAKGIPSQVINKPILAGKNSCCTETYIIARVTDTKEEAENVVTYMQTKFFRFLVLLNKPTQDALKGVYSLVPEQDFSKPWTDQELYEKYGLTQDEIDYIESMIRPMDSKEE